MFTLIMCVGFLNGVCEKVEKEVYHTRSQCEQAKEFNSKKEDLIFITCKSGAEESKNDLHNSQ